MPRAARCVNPPLFGVRSGRGERGTNRNDAVTGKVRRRKREREKGGEKSEVDEGDGEEAFRWNGDGRYTSVST